MEKVKAWKTAVTGDEGTELCSNLVCLSPNAHAYWDRTLFALKPLSLSKDTKTLEVQFFWLAQRGKTRSVDILSRPNFPSNLDSPGNNIKLYNCPTDRKLCSGDVITLVTDDTDKQPLPSMAILQMQWYLQRVAALAGAADADSDDEDEDDEVL